MSGRQSLLLITVDCLRASHVGFLGYQRPTTPFLDSLGETSVVFSNAIVAGAPTYYSFPAIMASRHPLDLGREVVGLAPAEETIASVLRDSGYSTGAFLAGNPYLSPRFGYDHGFETFRDFLETDINSFSEGAPESANHSSPRGRFNRYLAAASTKFGMRQLYDELYFEYCQKRYRGPDESFDSLRRFPSADVIVDNAIEWLDGMSDSPFFLWLHFMDPHSPYYPRQEAMQWLDININARQARYLNSYWNRDDIGIRRLKRRQEGVVSLYDAGVRWADSQIGRLIDNLRSRELWKDCVCAVTADHGEEHLEHGGRYHPPSNLNEEIIHVPLLLRGPERSKRGTWTLPFSLIHLAPTLLDALGVQIPNTFRGRSFWTQSQDTTAAKSNDDDDVAIVESVATCPNPFDSAQRLGSRLLAIREAEYKLVFDFATSREDLFNLENDPGERQPLPRDAEKATRRRLLSLAREHLLQSTSVRNPDQCLKAQLRDIRLGWQLSAVNTLA